MCAYVCFSLQHDILTICDTSVIRNSFISQRDFDVFINYVLETHSLYAIMVTVTRNTEGIALIGTQSSRHLKLHVRCKETKWLSTIHTGHTNKKDGVIKFQILYVHEINNNIGPSNCFLNWISKRIIWRKLSSHVWDHNMLFIFSLYSQSSRPCEIATGRCDDTASGDINYAVNSFRGLHE